MKFIWQILPLFLMLLVLGSCAERVCPANAREVQHRQLTKINSKRKRDRGLFPKSTHPSKRKKKKKTTTTPDPVEEEL